MYLRRLKDFPQFQYMNDMASTQTKCCFLFLNVLMAKEQWNPEDIWASPQCLVGN